MKEQVRLVNLEEDMPTVKQAIDRLHLEVRLARSQGVRALKVIHGFGSTGAGGKIRVALRRELPSMERRGQVLFFIPGEQLTIFNEDTRRLLQLCPAFRRDHDIDRHNNGITVIVLGSQAAKRKDG